MARCKSCIHTDVCNREVGYGYAECPHYKSADIAPRAEFDRVARELERVEALYFAKDTQLENAKAEVAREIFEEIEEYTTAWCGDYYISIEKLKELKKKYTEGGK